MATAVSFGIKAWIEGGVVAAVIMLNVVMGILQQFSAEKTMDSLRSPTSPTTNVIRDGNAAIIPSPNVIVGDLVELKTGEAVSFETDEALLTGENPPVRKDEKANFDNATGPGDRLNIAYSSSTVTKGRARGIVFATGTCTEIGAIAGALRKKDSNIRQVKRKDDSSARLIRYVETYTLTFTDALDRLPGVNVGTPLQKKPSKLAVLLFFIAVVFAIVVLGASRFEPPQKVVIYAVATGLSIIPASLVIVLTVTMAAGTKRMVQRNGKMIAKRASIPAMGTYAVDTSSEPFNSMAGEVSFDSRQPIKRNSKKMQQSRSPRCSPLDFYPTAGIAVHMLTGDHPETVKAIAIEVVILPTRMELVRRDVTDAMVMTASKFDAWTNDQVDELPILPLVIARCAPNTKHRRGNWGGRRIFHNIQKFVLHVPAEDIAQAGILIGLASKNAGGLSVFPLSPAEIVWIIMITSGMPDICLGFEGAVPGIMSRAPQNLKTGIFDMEFMVEMVDYGVWIAALCLASFCLVLYGFGDGDLGENCNEDLCSRCAWEMVGRRRSLFRMQPGSKKHFTQCIHDVWRNKFLFWTIMMGFFTMFPVLYIPVLNTAVFKHMVISWEWGIVRRLRGDVGAGAAWKGQDIEHRAFAQYLSFSVSSEEHQNKDKVEKRE
ncbi:hypothetical protein DL768_009189 [Monosporascus sp. mg162]|nr:hypothetical protein DL768_009189 [Monosporascus sp. mg162]